MAATASPYGLRPVQLVGGLPFAGAIRAYSLTLNRTGAFYYGDPVSLVAGQPDRVLVSPTTTANANSPIGVFMGCEWQDPIRGFVNAQSFPANGILGGFTKVVFKILDYPWCIWRAQANGPVTPDKVGLNVALANLGTGNAASGDSTVSVDAAAATTNTLAMRIIGFPLQTESVPGDAFTDLLVMWNVGVHRLQNGTGV
jgi:hypothetical protein